MNRDPNSPQYGCSTDSTLVSHQIKDPHHNMQSLIPSETQNAKIDYELVRRCLIYGSADEKCEVLDAVRSRITTSESNMGLNTIHEILYSDLLRISCVCDEKSLLEDLLWPKNIITPHPLQISMARLLNVLLSYKIGREYFNKKPIIQLLIWDDPERDHIEQEVADNLIAVMMKLSLNRFQCADMIKKGLLIWMVCHMAEVLMAKHLTAKCHLESMTGLLRMLLSEDSAFICFDTGFIDVKNFILLLVSYLEMDNEIVKRNIYACLLAMLKKPEFVKIAKEIDIAKVIKEHIEKTKLVFKGSIQGQDSNTIDLHSTIGTNTTNHVDRQKQDKIINDEDLDYKKTDIYQEISDEILSLRLAEYEFGSNESQNSTSTGRLANNLKLTQEGLEKLRAAKIKTQLKPIGIMEGQSFKDANPLKGGDSAGGTLDTQRLLLGKIYENTYNLSSLSNEDVKKKSKLMEHKHMQAVFELLTQSGGRNDLLYTLDTRLDENELYFDSKMDFNNDMKIDCHPHEQLIRTKFSENQWEPNSSFIPEYNLEYDGPFLSRIYVERELPKIEGNRIFPMLHFRSVNRSERTCIRFYEKTSTSGPHHLHSPNASKIILPRWKEFQGQMSRRDPNAQTNQSHSADINQYSDSIKLCNGADAEREERLKSEENSENYNLSMRTTQQQKIQSSQVRGIESSQLQATQSFQMKITQSSQLKANQSSPQKEIQMCTTKLAVYKKIQENEEQTFDLQPTISVDPNIQIPGNPPFYPLGKSSSPPLGSPSSQQLGSLSSHLQGSLQLETTEVIEKESDKENYEETSDLRSKDPRSAEHFVHDIRVNNENESHFSPLQGTQSLQLKESHLTQLQETQSLQGSGFPRETVNLAVEGNEKNEAHTSDLYEQNNDEANILLDDECQEVEINDGTERPSAQQQASPSSQILGKSSSQLIQSPSSQLPSLVLQENMLRMQMTDLAENEIIQNIQENYQQTFELKLINEEANHNKDLTNNDKAGSPTSKLQRSQSSQVQMIQSSCLPRSQSLDAQESMLSIETSELLEKETSQRTVDLHPKLFPRSKETIVSLGNENQDDETNNVQEKDEQISDLLPKISEDAHIYADNDNQIIGIQGKQTTIETANEKENEKIKKQTSLPYFSSANSSFKRNVEVIYDGKEYTDSTSPHKLRENLKKTEDGLEHLLSMKRKNDTFQCIGNKKSEGAKQLIDESLERQSVNKDKEVVMDIIEDMALGVNNDNVQKESSNDQKSAVAIPIIAQKPSHEIYSKDQLLTVDEIVNNEKLVNFFCEKMISKIAARNDFCGPNCGSTCGGLNKSKMILEKSDKNADDAASSSCQVIDTGVEITGE